MRAEPEIAIPRDEARPRPQSPRWTLVAVALAALTGLGLMADSLQRSSATYDEVAYLRIAAHWWRTGDQEEITRMGSPLTFWKLQQVPVLWFLDGKVFCWNFGPLAYESDLREFRPSHVRSSIWIDAPLVHQSELLPLLRTWSLTIWLIAFGLTALWARRLYGPRAMALAAWLFALSPNLLAHGALITMELPLLACTTGMFLLFWQFLRSGDRRAFLACAALGGLAFSCKFTTVVLPPILALAWWVDRWWYGDPGRLARFTGRVIAGMIAFVAVMLISNVAITGGALLPISTSVGNHPSLEGRLDARLGRWITRAVETPIPQDWAGFARQMQHQRSGGSSYLFGERRMKGWWYYYFVVLAVKLPLTFWLLVAARFSLGPRPDRTRHDLMLPLVIAAFLAITALGSSRNYGLRYLLPLAPVAIVWVSALAEGSRWPRRLARIGLLGQAIAVASIHPYELSYFNALAGGPIGGRRILADSNLDWGQGAKPLARLQRDVPEFRDLTLYYFGDTDPRYYGVVGTCHVVGAGDEHPGLPTLRAVRTKYVAVSASLQHGPWGPVGFFRDLDGVPPVRMTDDRTIALYEAAAIAKPSR